MVKPSFSDQDVEIESRSTLFRGFFKLDKLRLRHRLFAGGWSAWFERELFVRGPAVAAVLYDPARDRVGLVEQFRVGALGEAAGPWCLEAVAGMSHPGEAPEEVIRREIAEEAGLVPKRLIPICHYLSSPGGSDERLQLYCAICDLEGEGGVFGLADEHEDIRLHLLDAEPLLADLYNSRCNNAASLICLQWLAMHREQLRAGRL